MAGILSYLPFYKAPPPLPEVVPTDEVVPVHLFDDTANLRGIIMVWTFKFEEVLDPEKLNESLSQLFRMEGWRKFGGRWRQNPNGKLEIHIPSPFTKERPPVHFTKDHHDMPINEHPLASKLPQATGRTETYLGPRNFVELGLEPGHPRKFDEYLHSDTPQFSLHVVTFTDGTLVSVTHSHMTTDLLGLASVVNAWSLILAGKSESVLPLEGFEDDGMKGLWDPPAKEKHILAGGELSGWRLAYWALTSLWEAWRANLQGRTLCIPKKTMDKMVFDARGHIAGKKSSNDPQRDAFISEGDVLAALASRMIAKNQYAGSNRNIMTWMALDPRTRVKSFRQDAAYVQNSPTAVFFNCPADQALELPLGELALVAREAIAAQATEEQLKAYTCLSVDSMKSSGSPVLFGDKNMAFQVMSNWLKANLFEKMDFSPAIEKEAASPKAGHARGHPTFYQSTDPESPSVTFIMHLVVVTGTDHDGNTWLSCVLPERTWSNLLEHLGQYEE